MVILHSFLLTFTRGYWEWKIIPTDELTHSIIFQRAWASSTTSQFFDVFPNESSFFMVDFPAYHVL
jgi:hypothetical protein